MSVYGFKWEHYPVKMVTKGMLSFDYFACVSLKIIILFQLHDSVNLDIAKN